MNIFTATGHFSSLVRTLFREQGSVEILPPRERWEKLSTIDLLVFTGGEDIAPRRYGQENTNSYGINTERDQLEFDILKAAKTGKLPVKKILGICRGIQLLNSSFGGSLTQDIFAETGKRPRPTHPLRFLADFPLTSTNFPVVNSMHHQAVKYVGESYPYKIIAVDANTENLEIVLWEDRFLGVQFHPEFMSPNSLHAKTFSAMIDAWISGMSLNRKSALWSKENFKDPKKEKKVQEEKISTEFTKETQKRVTYAWDETARTPSPNPSMNARTASLFGDLNSSRFSELLREESEEDNV